MLPAHFDYAATGPTLPATGPQHRRRSHYSQCHDQCPLKGAHVLLCPFEKRTPNQHVPAKCPFSFHSQIPRGAGSSPVHPAK